MDLLSRAWNYCRIQFQSGVDFVEGPQQLTTERMDLRRPRTADVDSIFKRYASDADVCRFLAWPRHETIRDTHAFIEFSDAEWAKWPAGPYLCFAKQDGLLLGSTGLDFESDTVASTGYAFASDAWGRGYATEALGAMCHLARKLGVRRLYSHVFPDHTPSRRVLEKAGFVLDDTILTQFGFPNIDQDQLFDVVTYEQIPDED